MSADTKPLTPARAAATTKQRPAWLTPQNVTVIALIVVTLEALLYAVVRWPMWGYVNLALLAVVACWYASVQWVKRKARATAARAGRPGGATAIGGRPSPGSPSATRRGGLLGRLTGGRLGSASRGTPGATPGGATPRRRGPLGRLFGPRGGATPATRGGRPGGATPGGRTGGRQPGGGAPATSGRRGPWRKLTDPVAARREARRKRRDDNKAATDPVRPDGRSGPPRTGARPPAQPRGDTKPSPPEAPKQAPPKPPSAGQAPPPVPSEDAQKPPKEQQPMGDETETTLKVNEDTSLQAWGRNLRNVEPAITEVRDGHRPGVERDRATASALTKMAQQADHDLPVAKPLAAETDALAKEAQAIANESEALQARRLALANRAAGLPKMYDYQHGNDEDRLNEPRNGQQAEMRADVRHAAQDT